MKKIAVIAAMVIALNNLSPLVNRAEAAFIEDKVIEAIAQSPNAARIQELLQIKEQLQQSDKDVLLGALAQAAVNRVAPQIGTVNTTDLAAVAQTAVQQQLTQNLSKHLASYQDQLAVIATLFNVNNNLAPKVVQDNNSLIGAPENYRQIIDMTATAYAPGPLDNGKWNDKTYLGGTVRYGVAAVDPNVIPMGSKLWIEGYGPAIAEDQGSAIKGNRIDLAFNNRQQALDYGIQKIKVYVLN